MFSRSGYTHGYAVSLLLFAFALALGACNGGSADPRAAQVASGELPVNYLHIYDKNELMSFGSQVLSSSGNFEPVGPTIVLIVRNIPQEGIDELAADGIKVEAHTAYLLAEGDKAPTNESLKRMSRIDDVDAALSPAEVRTHFRMANER